MADPVVQQVPEFEEFVEIPVLPPPPSENKGWPRSARIAVSLALAILPLGLLWISVGALWGQAFTSTPGSLMPALTGISVNSALLFIFITDFIAARTGYSA